MDYIDVEYINRISTGLRNFKHIENKWIFSCPICGDSKKDRRKARGEIYQKDNKMWFYCHNQCGGFSFANFLKEYDIFAYNEYVSVKYRKKTSEIYTTEKPKQEARKISILDGLSSVNSLDFWNPVWQYVLSRKIPSEFYSELFSCPKFKCFTNQQLPGKFDAKALAHEEQRLLIPFFDENKNVIAFSGRSLEKDSRLRYININLDETRPKIYGLNRWKKGQKTTVLEGPLDSLFLPNAIASAGGSLISVLKGYDKNQFVIVFDNEPMSVSTKEKMKRAIEQGFKVCVWPRSIEDKDINKMILTGMSSEKIQNIIDENTFSGMAAHLKLVAWSKK